MDRIKNLSLDQKAKLYYMALLQKGIIDTLPEDPKAAYIRDMMDKEDPKMDPAIRSDFDEPMFENDPKDDAEQDEFMGPSRTPMTHDDFNKKFPDNEDDEGGKPEGYYDIPDSLKELATQLGYLNEIDLNAVSYEKVTFVYTEQGGRFYGLDVYESKDQPQRSDKLRYDEANEWLKDTLAYIHKDDLIPKKYISGLEDLDLIVARLKELGIEASHNDFMDVS